MFIREGVRRLANGFLLLAKSAKSSKEQVASDQKHCVI